MRTFLAVLCIVIAVVVGYSYRGVPVNAQAAAEDWIPFTTGEIVTLHVDLPGSLIVCKVTQVQNGFVGCARDPQKRQSIDQWVNLRFVETITPREP